jgi:hypothetical protein
MLGEKTRLGRLDRLAHAGRGQALGPNATLKTVAIKTAK